MLRYLLPLLLLAGAASAQLTVVIPNGTATTEGSTSNAFPWGRGGMGLRHQSIYSASHFTQQGITTPITIMRLRYRANGGATTAASNYPVGGTVTMSTSPVIWSAVNMNFATQTGPDATVVFNGPMSWPAATGAPGPQPFLIDVPLGPFFIYDPQAGDLNIDTDIPIQAFAGTSLQLDVHSAPASRVFLSTGYVNNSGNPVTTFAPTLNHGVVVEITYVPVGGGSVATRLRYGTGCIDRAASFYQQFAPGTFNLSSSSLMMVPTGSGYVVVPGGAQWRPPAGTTLALADNAVSAPQPLGFTFNYPGGSTSNLHVSSNGFVWMQPNNDHGCCAPVPGNLLSMGARYCALWTDLNPIVGGTVRYEVDAQSQTAYVTFTSVPEAGSTTNVNSFQYAFQQGGTVEMRWQQCSVMAQAALVGWSPGVSARDPGSTTIATSLPLLLQPDMYGLALDGSARPVTGTSVTMTTRNIPAGTPLGAIVFSLTQVNPGQSLAPLGMPGCLQYVGLDFTAVFVPTGTTGTFPFTVPNNTGLSGMRFFCQSATFSQGFNALGVLASNGVDFLVGTL